MKSQFRHRVMEWQRTLLALDDPALANFINWRLDQLWQEWESEEFEDSHFFILAKRFCVFRLDEPAEERDVERAQFLLKPIAEIRAWLARADAKQIHASLIVCVNPGSPFPEFVASRIVKRLAYYRNPPHAESDTGACPRCSSDDFDWDADSLSFVCEDCSFHFVHSHLETAPHSKTGDI